MHWHELVHLASGRPMAYGFEHEWTVATGHPSPANASRPHVHIWTEAGVRDALRGHVSAAELEEAVRAMAGLPQTGPSAADRPGDVSAWLGNEEAVARTLHPELRPARLRDA